VTGQRLHPSDSSPELRVAGLADPYRPLGRRLAFWCGLGLLLLALAMMVALAAGSWAISPWLVARILWLRGLAPGSLGGLEPSAGIILDIRLPRVLVGGAVGASLALAGVAAQGLLMNPLADPYILGVSSGAAFGASVAMSTRFAERWGGLGVPAAAFAGAAVTLALVYRLGRTNGRLSLHQFLLSGVVVGSFLWAAITLVLSLAGQDVQRLLYWLLGSLNGREWRDLAMIGPALLVSWTILFLTARDLNLMSLGEETAHSLGVPPERAKLLVLGAAALATAAAVAVSGIIGFVGLMVPHIVRRVVGPDHRVLLPAAALIGAAFLMLADTIARGTLISSTLGELPVGVVTALTGAPFFIYLMRTRDQI
jgi:iron complex transport system permease protein